MLETYLEKRLEIKPQKNEVMIKGENINNHNQYPVYVLLPQKNLDSFSVVTRKNHEQLKNYFEESMVFQNNEVVIVAEVFNNLASLYQYK